MSVQMESIEVKSDLEFDEKLPFSTSPAKSKVHLFNSEMSHTHMHPSSDVRKSRVFNLVWKSPLRSLYIVLIRAKINILLPFGPLAIFLHYVTEKHVWNMLFFIISSILASFGRSFHKFLNRLEYSFCFVLFFFLLYFFRCNSEAPNQVDIFQALYRYGIS